MIIDKLENIAIYATLHTGITTALNFLSSPHVIDLVPGRYNIAGDDIFAIVDKCQGRGREKSPLEVHKKYIDVQYVVSGDEWMGWAPFADCRLDRDGFSSDQDIGLCVDFPQSWLQVLPGYFTIFYPSDAHAPLAGMGAVHKIVVKVKCGLEQ